MLQKTRFVDTLSPSITAKKPELVALNKPEQSVSRRYKPVSKPGAEQLSEVDEATNTPPALANAENKVAYNAPVYKSTTSFNKDKDTTPLNEVARNGLCHKEKNGCNSKCCRS